MSYYFWLGSEADRVIDWTACRPSVNAVYEPIDTKTKEAAVSRFIGGPWGGFPIPEPKRA